MNWVNSIFIGLLTGALGLFAGGLLGAANVNWYRISGFEGKSGYFMAALALLGAFFGLVLGIAASRIVGGAGAAGFFKGLGYSWGILLATVGAAALVCRLLADVPPRIDGQTLNLEVEIRLPVNVTSSPATATNSALILGSVINHVQRKSESGELRPAEARLENGRWIIPGSVEVFTSRGLRSIDAQLEGKSIGAFIVPLPGSPDSRYEQWSGWQPQPRAGAAPWPDTNPSYRFRIQRVVPAAPAPEPEPATTQEAK